MKRYIVLSLFVIAMAILGKSVLFSDDVTPNLGDPCPCSALYPGYYFTGQYYPYKPVFFTNMPLEQFVGYTIMDSIITYGHLSYPTTQTQENFIKSLTCAGDTLNYALKYLYRMADYNPFLYYNFLTSYQQGKRQPMTLLPKLLDQVKKVCGLPVQEVIKAEYILHLRVNAVDSVVFDRSLGFDAKMVYVYAQVLDVIKGQVLPELSTAIEVFEQDSAGTKVKKSKPLDVPPNTDFIYHYYPGWTTNLTKAKEDREYIVFAYNMGACITRDGQYYDIRPTLLNPSNKGVIPITADGNNVYDRGNTNSWNWGEYVPVDVFKTNLRALINSIKNYGE